MINEIDLALRALLIFASVFAIVGLSWKLMVLIGKTTESLEEFRQTNKRINTLVEKAGRDYDYISSTVKSLSITIDRMNREILNPILSVSKVFRAVEYSMKGMWLRMKNESDPEDYLPNEE